MQEFLGVLESFTEFVREFFLVIYPSGLLILTGKFGTQHSFTILNDTQNTGLRLLRHFNDHDKNELFSAYNSKSISPPQIF